MNTIQAEILPDGMAIEVNALGERPDITISYKDCTKKLCAEVSKGAMCHGVCWRKEEAEEHWEIAEQKRRVFKIVNEMVNNNSHYKPKNDPLPAIQYGWKKLIIGSIHTAEIVNEKEVIIL